MKKLIQAVLLTAVFSSPAFADFSGSYAVGLWNLVEDGGTVDTSGAPGSVTLISNNVGTNGANQDFTFVAFEDVTIEFTWNYSTVDSGTSTTQGAQWDPFGYLHILVGDTDASDDFIQLSDNAGADNQSGTVSFAVLAGETFGFRANTVDGIFGAATTIVSGFTATPPAVVPVPPSFGLLGFALCGLFMVRRGQLPQEQHAR